MEQLQIITKLKSIFDTELPGLQAQLQLAPPYRDINIDLQEKKLNAKQSAVCVLLYLKEKEIHTILMKRSLVGKHAGQISFPGGKVELYDENYKMAALREFQEEIGELKQPIYLGQLTPLYIPPSDFYVEPYLFFTAEEIVYSIQESEVVQVIETNLNHLFLEENFKELEITNPQNKKVNVPSIIYNDHAIWGATAMILSELKAIWANNSL